ncbi:MAG: C69 family dipeptidase [Alistipes sp.]|nr:C69 family dipeptidase [Alistipes sp.]MBR3775243.1 C69 family dipeptidase [Alistipes sp.]
MKKLFSTLMLAVATIATPALACTNFIITRGASTDGSVMVTYAADSHALYGALYKHNPAAKYNPMLAVYEWDSGKYLGDIPEAQKTYSTVGNMNEHSVIITETTFGGRSELRNPSGLIDYGSLIYITLQRATSAREAIDIIVELANTYGYYSGGESFSIADENEAWIMELIGKGKDKKGIVWVARRVPDGYISAHANQARITTFPLNDKENCLYAEDVITLAREKGYFSGKDEEFSFAGAYAPLDFSAMRACEARVWSFFRMFAEGMDKYEDYAMGYNAHNPMPLWVKPTNKISPKQVFDAMRDHYEGTKMDMTTDIGAGGHGLPYRWRPMNFEVDGKTYLNERAIATQQTAFWLCGQARKDKVGILWFGMDDAATSCLTPIYCNTTEVPATMAEGNGSMLDYSDTSAFWIFNRVTNFAYLRYDLMSKDIRKVVDYWENTMLKEVESIDAKLAGLSEKALKKQTTEYSNATAQKLFDAWTRLDKYLLLKYIDGNVKSENADVLSYVIEGKTSDKHFVENGNGKKIPGKIQQPGYSEKWKRAVAADNGAILYAR